MAENTAIEWCDHTFNPWVGCTKVSPGCDHCYAEGWAKRSGSVQWGGDRRRTTPANWRLPLKWNAQAEREGKRYRVFCASLADVFDNQVPGEWREDLFELIRQTPHLDWQLLTKRPQNIVRMVREQGAIASNGMRYLPDNVWLGTTCEDQQRADLNIPALLRCRAEIGARVLFVSIEPMLGPIDLTAIKHTASPGFFGDCLERHHRPHDERHTKWPGIDWVIVGGESGPGARPMHPDWARTLRDQCAAAGVPFLFKQWGEWRPMRFEDIPKSGGMNAHLVSDGSRPAIGDGCFQPSHALESMVTDPAYGWQMPVLKVGKKAAGRLLDGREHNGFPPFPPPNQKGA